MTLKAPQQDLFINEKQQWLLEARKVARDLLQERDTITILDVLARKPFPAFLGKRKKNVIGHVFKDSIFKRIGYTKSNLRDAHAHVIGVWTLKEEPLRKWRTREIYDAGD